MDSMRSLNRSLPKSTNARSAPPEEFLQAFRTAALSVTNLYKSAVTDHLHSRQEGYQDALDDLLVFLDRENIGLQDGEGWRIRQWINDRYERASTGAQQPDSDDDAPETEQRPRISSPVQTIQRSDRTTQHKRSQSEQPISPEKPSTSGDASESAETSTFRFKAGEEKAEEQSQTDHPMLPERDASCERVQSQPTTTTTHLSPARVDAVPRAGRIPHRNGPRNNNRPTTREVAINTGSKRKFQFPDFFDISNVQFGRDGHGCNGKRGRLA